MATGALIGVNKWTSYPGGFGGGVVIQEIPSLGNFPGTVLWVSSTTGSDNNHGTFKKPYATIVHALSMGNTVNRPNLGISTATIIVCMPGHVETVKTSGGLMFSTINNLNMGVDVYFCGGGLNRASIQFSSATTASMIVNAANVRLFSPLFINGSISAAGGPQAAGGVDALVSPIIVQANGFQMFNAEYYDSPAKATLVQVLTNVSAYYMGIYGYRYIASTTGTQKTSGIKLVGAMDHVEIMNANISGDFTGAPVNNSSGALTNLVLDSLNLANLNATPTPALALVGTTQGVMANCLFGIASGAQFTSAHVLGIRLCYGYVIGTGGGTAITVSN
jgi:hypothetical protein